MWSKKDLKWLKQNYPAVKKLASGALSGPLVFRMLFKDGNRYINPSDELVAKGNSIYISAMYNVSIEHQGNTSFPKVFETSGKIQAVANSKGLRMIDLHTFPNDNDALCLASPMVTYPAAMNGISLQAYVEDFLIPYLFAQEHFAKTDIWPWGDLSHGLIGHLEWLGRIDQPVLRDAKVMLLNIGGIEKPGHFHDLFSIRPRFHKPCICGSKKKFRKCHPDAKTGITVVRKYLYSRKLDLTDFI